MEIANVEQAEAWDGEEGDDWAANAERYERSAWRLEPYLVNPSVIGAGDRVLDIGCGTGRSTIDAAKLASRGSALGVDLSSKMLARARDQAAAEGVDNVSFVQADAQVHRFEAEAADVAISDFGAMFFNDPVAAFTNVASACRPGARLALLSWRALADNEWTRELRHVMAAGRTLPEPPPGAPGPFGHADAGVVSVTLGRAGFTGVEIEAVDEPIVFGTDVDAAYAFVSQVGFVRGMLADLDEATRERTLAALRASLEAHAGPEGVAYGSAAWLITARRAG